jgi:hypothetical protein
MAADGDARADLRRDPVELLGISGAHDHSQLAFLQVVPHD